MKKCRSWLKTEDGYNYDYGICLGTKECDPCDCGGDEAKCDFYPHVRRAAIEPEFGQWISVKDRLPEYKTAVLGYGLRHREYLDTDPFPAVHVVYSRGEDEGWFTFWNNEYVAVTHWMPLPSAPEGE